MSAVAAANTAAAEIASGFDTALIMGAYEHLHLHQVRTHWASKRHDNLGAHLQEALDALDREGWEVVTSFLNHGGNPEFILRRRKGHAA